MELKRAKEVLEGMGISTHGGDTILWRIAYTVYGQYQCPIGWRNWWAFSEESSQIEDRLPFRDAVHEDIRGMY